MSARYAVYFVPEDSSGLAAFGNQVLGRDARGNHISPSSEEHSLRGLLSPSVSRYGFHATLKAPFELCSEQTEDALRDAVHWLADSLSPLQLSGLRPRRMDRHIVLSNESDSAELQQLAERCVIDFEPFRAPPREADRQRRVHPGMSCRQLENLERYGYAHIFEDFRFHMTLGGPISSGLASSPIDAAEVSAYLAWLNGFYDRLVTETPMLDRLVLSFQKDRESAFVRMEERVFSQQ